MIFAVVLTHSYKPVSFLHFHNGAW